MKDNPKQGYTIRAISKKLKLPYSNINRAVKSLIKEEILNTKDIGRAKYCSLNLNSDSTINLLCQISIQDKKRFLKTIALNPFPKNVPDIVSVITLKKNKTKSRIFIITNKKDASIKAQLNSTKTECSLLETKEFIALVKNKAEFKEELLHNSIILQGYENYWNLIKEVI